MRATLDHRFARAGGGLVRLEMSLRDFRELVEWLEMLRPEDGCTKDFRATLDELDPPEPVAS